MTQTTLRQQADQHADTRAFILRIGLCAAAILVTVIAGMLATGSSKWTRAELGALEALSLSHTPFLTMAALAINTLFSPTMGALLLVAVTIAVAVVTRQPAVGLRYAVVVAGSWFGSEVIKWLVHRPRPDHSALAHPLIIETSFSYPSGHTAIAASLGLGLILLARGRSWCPALVATMSVLALVVAWSRLYIGVHYPSDVAASLVCSTAAVICLDAVWGRFIAPRIDARRR